MQVASDYHRGRTNINTPDYIDNIFENGTECNFYGRYEYFSGFFEITSSLANVSCYPGTYIRTYIHTLLLVLQ